MTLPTIQTAPAAAALPEPDGRPDDGRHDFDFALGRWRIHNRKLANILDLTCTDWVEFEAICEMRPILNGLGNFDTFIPLGLPADNYYEGATLRMYDPATRLWQIWWASSRSTGRLDEPVQGRFDGQHGQFFGDDVISGTPVKVRYDWSDVEPGSTRWEQAFSSDGGATWATNWVMTATREDAS
jgi:hypothetical protein